jgi:biopolymer transport protein ExbB
MRVLCAAVLCSVLLVPVANAQVPQPPAAVEPALAPPAPIAAPPAATQAQPDAPPAMQPNPSPVMDVAPNFLPRDLTPSGMFMSADIVVKAVMFGLIFASWLTWTIWLGKTLELIAATAPTRPCPGYA